MSRRVFSISASEEDLEEKVHLLEAKIQSLEVLLHDTRSTASTRSSDVNDKSNIGEENDKQRKYQNDVEKSLQTPEKTERNVSFSDAETTIPDTPSTDNSEEDDDFVPNPRRFVWPSPSSSFSRPALFAEQSVINEDVDDVDYFKELNEDTFTLMILSKPCTKQWFFGLVVFTLQMSLLFMILVEQYGHSKGSTPLDVPFKVDVFVQIGQLLAIIVSLATQTDLVTAIITFMMLWTQRRAFWTSLIKVPENSSLWVWLKRIAFPIACEFFGGLLVLLCTFVIVITSDSVIDLFKDFAAMQVISQLDDMMFWMALHGYTGKDMAHGAKQARKIRIHDREIKTLCGIPFRTIILMFIFGLMGGGWAYFVHGQVSGEFFKLKFPHCQIPDDSEVSYMDMGDKICNGPLNNIECGFDDGDCIAYNLAFPNCRVSEPDMISNGVCDNDYNTKDCNFDGGDCCPAAGEEFRDGVFLGDGICNGGIFNTAICNFDEGDCAEMNKQYPDCELLDPRNDFLNDFDYDSGIPPGLGDGQCNGGPHNVKECGYDGGDCVECNTKLLANGLDPDKIGDGYCDGGLYMEFGACNSDGGDCDDFEEVYPWCSVPEPERIENGICDGGAYMSSSCDHDGGDCSYCSGVVPNILLVGDGWCDGGVYMSQECGRDGGDCANCIADPSTIGNGVCDISHNTTECSWDGGDCLEGGRPIIPCNVPAPKKLGDYMCDGEYNTAECSWDGGDCVHFNYYYPNCRVDDVYYLSNGYCDAEYNTEECEFDGGDCNEFNSLYPDCKVEYPDDIGDGTCKGGEYNTEECGFDGGDCADFNEEYPGCNVTYIHYVGDGQCDGDEYNTAECAFDGGDCIESEVDDDGLNACFVDFPTFIGDGHCDGPEYNTAECAFDGGDCATYNQIYPNCTVDFPWRIGDSICNGAEYNTTECGFDGGDCEGTDIKMFDIAAFVEEHPNCRTYDLSFVGDGFCQDFTNNRACGFDGGDCEVAESCNVEFPSILGDGHCDGREYNSADCAFDEGDCFFFNNAYPGCDVDFPWRVGDGICNGPDYNTTECGFDGGDCVAENSTIFDLVQFVEDHPDCSEMEDLYFIHNGECDSYTNNKKCDFDGGDCVLPECKEFYNVSSAIECVSSYAEDGKCNLSNWLDMFFNCQLHEAGINDYLSPIVQADECTWENFTDHVSNPLFEDYLVHCWDDVPCVKYETMHDATDCVALYMQEGKCDWEHWSEMVDSCSLEEGGLVEYLLPIVKNDKCTWQRWSDHVYHELFFYVDHCTGSGDTDDTNESYD